MSNLPPLGLLPAQVNKRIEYIKADATRIERSLKAKNDEQNTVKEQIQALQKGK